MTARRRARVAVPGGVVIGVAVALGLWIGGARGYDGIERGSLASAEPRAPIREGSATRVGITVQNSGGRGVKVEAIGDGESENLESDGVWMAATESGEGPGRLVRFRPFELGPRHERYVELRFRMRGCRALPRGTVLSVGSISVRYRTLIFERTKAVRLDTPLELVRRGRC